MEKGRLPERGEKGCVFATNPLRGFGRLNFLLSREVKRKGRGLCAGRGKKRGEPLSVLRVLRSFVYAFSSLQRILELSYRVFPSLKFMGGKGRGRPLEEGVGRPTGAFEGRTRSLSLARKPPGEMTGEALSASRNQREKREEKRGHQPRSNSRGEKSDSKTTFLSAGNEGKSATREKKKGGEHGG